MNRTPDKTKVGLTPHKLVIFDDEMGQAESLLKMVEKYDRSSEFETRLVRDWQELRSMLVTDKIDILLMDIKIESESFTGIDLVKKSVPTQSPMQVVFVTNYDDYHASAYRAKHTGFLLKPVHQLELNEALDTALSRFESELERPFWVHTLTGEKVINPRRLRYAESNRRVLSLHVDDEVVETYGKISDLIQKLPQRFIQCHKSFIVNMGFIDEFRQWELKLTTGETVPISQKRRAAARETFFDYIGRTLEK